MPLRDYQQAAVDRLFEYWEKHSDPCVLQLCTGAGKSHVIAEIVNLTNAPTLVLQPTKEILEQNYEKLLNTGFDPLKMSVCSASAGSWNINQFVTFATIGTIAKHYDFCQHIKTVIIDEVDVVPSDRADSQYMQFLNALPSDTRIVGLSATPWRNVVFTSRFAPPKIFCRPMTRIHCKDGENTRLGAWPFKHIIYRLGIKDLQDRGFLAKTVYHCAETDWSFVNDVPGRMDYDTSDMLKWTDIEDNTSRFTQAIKWCMDNRLKTIIFTPNIDMNFRLQNVIQQLGGTARCMDSDNDTKKSREQKMQEFRDGKWQFLVNVGMVGRGVDVPTVDAVILCRPTKSLSLYMQCLSMDTEVLTASGWKKYGEIREGEALPTLNLENGRGEWDVVQSVVHRKLNDDEKWVVFDSPYASIKVTDKHRMIRKRYVNKNGEIGWQEKWEVVTADKFVERKSGQRVPTSVVIDQPGVPLSDDDLWLVGMLMTDGSWKNGPHGELTGNLNISQTDQHQWVLDEIEKRLKNVGLRYTKKLVRKIGATVPASEYFSLKSGKDIVAKHNGYVFSLYMDAKFRYRAYLTKDLSPLLMSINRHQFGVLLEGMWAGDGTKKVGVDYTVRTKEITTAREIVAQKLQMLAAINGYHCFIRKEGSKNRKNPIWVMSFKDQDWKVIGNAEKSGTRPKVHFETSLQNDECWCVETVKNKTLITRHNGKVTVMGNCIGRSLRIDPANPDKPAYILDLAGNVERFGRVEDVRLIPVEATTDSGWKYIKETIVHRPGTEEGGDARIFDRVS